MASFSKGTSFTDGVTGDVTAAKLHALVDAATPVPGFITDRTAEATVASDDVLLISDTSEAALNKMTVANLFKAELTGTINSTAGTITAATIPTLTAGTTTGTAATFTSSTLGTTTGTAATFTTGTFTTGVIPTLTAGTTIGTAASFTTGTLTTGVIPTLTIGSTTATTGTITTLNSTTGTITNLSTTLAGDFTISSGTGTLGTTGVAAGTYGTTTAVPQITVDAKGRVTTISTQAIPSTPAAWVNFNGVGTIAIRASGNVSSITDDGVGSYTVNFSVALNDTNYCPVFGSLQDTLSGAVAHEMGVRTASGTATNIGTSTLAILTKAQNGSIVDSPHVYLAIFR